MRTISGAILFASGMRIDADGAPNAYGPQNTGLDYTANAKNGPLWSGVATDSFGNPVVQRSGRYKGLYVSQTTLRKDGDSAASPRTYVNASRIPFIALPGEFTQQFGVNLGDLAVVLNTANVKRAYAIYADVGPNGKIGEGSIALAKALGIDAKPRDGGVSGSIVYLVFPKSGLGQGK
ncbi:MAG TPA: glycoside hydrolase family 75 protein, partial [Candidatus Angelobacter sp.]|nr:glycoside hydrolase family 75 protein [Candidatus Angelobacter sp.]